MKTQITFRHVKSHHPKLQDEANSIMESFSKYTDEITSANVEFLNENNKTVIITVHMNGNVLVAKEETDDFHKSLNEASEKIIRQIRKVKTKQINSRTKKVS